MLLRLDNASLNPGIKGWVPADKSALISKGSQHLLIKRCVSPFPYRTEQAWLRSVVVGLVGLTPGS